nr:ribonuclease H-like domain-containing protein [Tanacetum cinerariifolium]
MKGIKREFSVARTPQQNRIAERNNRTLIEAARTMLVDLLLPITFWAEAVNTACYVHNRVLVTKPHNKTPYELLIGRSLNLNFMRPFGWPVTILNTLNHLGKFKGKADEGFLVGYSINSKAFRGGGSRVLVESHHTPLGAPTTSQPPLSSPSRILTRQETKVPQPSSPTHTHVADKPASIDRVLALETDLQQIKKVYSNVVTKLIMKVKKLEKIVKSTKAKRRAKIVVSVDEDAVEDSFKQGRKIDDIDQDLNISL